MLTRSNITHSGMISFSFFPILNFFLQLVSVNAMTIYFHSEKRLISNEGGIILHLEKRNLLKLQHLFKEH